MTRRGMASLAGRSIRRAALMWPAASIRFTGTYLFRLVGASPELLVGTHGGELFTRPLSGTVRGRLSHPPLNVVLPITTSPKVVG